MRLSWLWMAIAAFLPFLASVAHAQNLLVNGDFERGLGKTEEPVGWHWRITSITPVPEYRDPVNKKGRTGVVRFKCACEHEWGTVRPWTQLVCPKCGQMNTGLEDSSAFYARNFESCGLVEGVKGKAAGIRMDEAVASVQGVRVISTLVKAERGAGYEIAFDALSRGPTLKVFVEGFRLEVADEEAKRWATTLPAQSNPLRQTTRLKRTFRKQVDVQNPGNWKHFAEGFVPPRGHEIDAMSVTLYAYYPKGEAAFDNVVLRKLSQREAQDVAGPSSRTDEDGLR